MPVYQKNVVFFTGPYGVGKTTTLRKTIHQLDKLGVVSKAIIFDFTTRIADVLGFPQNTEIKTVLMGCNGCADSESYVGYIDQYADNTVISCVEVPNDRINILSVAQGLENKGYGVHIFGVGENTLNNYTPSSFSDLAMSLSKPIPQIISELSDVLQGYNNISGMNEANLQISDNHNAGGLLKPIITSDDLTYLVKLLESDFAGNKHIERLKGQFYYQGDDSLKTGWYDLEYVISSGKILIIPLHAIGLGFPSHFLSLVSANKEVRKDFNTRMVWKQGDISVSLNNINKPKSYVYDVLLGNDDFQETWTHIKNGFSEDHYDYRLLFANSMKDRTNHLMTDDDRKLYYDLYYNHKLKTLQKVLEDVNETDQGMFLLTLANLVYLLREDAVQDMTLDSGLRISIFQGFSHEQWMDIIEFALTYAQEDGIKEFTREKIEGYKQVIYDF